eukprot:NODE_22_length_38364_cov_0.248661.p24 type:complete len:141 gc:universal NODE_22_length_38364_cov_0.248661:31180-30758(-)
MRLLVNQPTSFAAPCFVAVCHPTVPRAYSTHRLSSYSPDPEHSCPSLASLSFSALSPPRYLILPECQCISCSFLLDLAPISVWSCSHPCSAFPCSSTLFALLLFDPVTALARNPLSCLFLLTLPEFSSTLVRTCVSLRCI